MIAGATLGHTMIVVSIMTWRANVRSVCGHFSVSHMYCFHSFYTIAMTSADFFHAR
jgi:hypothetical protein